MSGPDFAEPVLGFRIWEIAAGNLHGVAYDQRWHPGENVAVCRRNGTPHRRAPVAGCRCGFNALHELPPPASRYGAQYVAGAIAAWGDIEWHRTGFRAERACVLALCWDQRSPGEDWMDRARRAAAAYGVEVVPRDELFDHASRFARSLLPTPRVVADRGARTPAADTAAPRSDRDRGWWIGRHVVADLESRQLTIGLGSALGRTIDRGARMRAVVPAGPVSEGQTVATLSTGSGRLAVTSPVSGQVLELNPAVLADARLAGVDISEGGWVARIRPRHQRVDEWPLTWGRRGREGYASFVRRVGAEGMLDEVRELASPGAVDEVAAMRARLRRQAERASARLHAA